MAARLAAIVLAASAVAACSAGEREAEPRRGEDAPTASTGTAAPTTSVAVEAAPALEEILVPARAARPRHRFASLAELRWAAAWNEWREGLEAAADRLTVALDQRTAGAEPPRKALRRIGRCTESAAALGPVPSARLAAVARETAEVCRRYEVAAATLADEGLESGLPSEAVFAYEHLVEADRKLRTFVPGLDRDVDPLPLLDRPARGSRIQIRYTHAASRLLGRQVTVRCYGRADWRREVAAAGRSPARVAGFVRAHAASGNLSPTTCRWLDRLTYRKRPPGELLAMAYVAHSLATLGHEAKHAVGTRKESVAECFGMQQIRPLARALGAAASYARDLADIYWTRIFPNAPARYRSDACRPGGALDVRPGRSTWP